MCYHPHNSCLCYHNTQFFLHCDTFYPFCMITPLASCVLFRVTHSFTFVITHSHLDASYLHTNHPIVITRCCYLLSHLCYTWHKEASRNITHDITILMGYHMLCCSPLLCVINYVQCFLRILHCVTFIFLLCYMLCHSSPLRVIHYAQYLLCVSHVIPQDLLACYKLCPIPPRCITP